MASTSGNTTRPTCARASAFCCRTPTCSWASCATTSRSAGPNATDEEVLAAARLAGVESFIASHPLGYDMPISEGGRSLSGGQKQAIGLARVLIRNPKILFLDEPTAHFDVKSEAEFLERLKALAQRDMTIIVSTHRMSLLAFVDRLLVFDKGRLVADGPRDQVLHDAAERHKGAQSQTAARGPAWSRSIRNVLSSVGRSNAAV